MHTKRKESKHDTEGIKPQEREKKGAENYKNNSETSNNGNKYIPIKNYFEYKWTECYNPKT